MYLSTGADLEIRAGIYSANALGSLNATYRSVVRPRDRFPTEQAALKLLRLVPVASPHWSQPHSMDDAMYVQLQRIRQHLRRSLAGRGELLIAILWNHRH
ncbi:transposase [Microbacterium esteraromaticum]|uniref:transposase n=1 Tax=Microbacterium esteraromaticum TaxID=57043 RepID=UPI000B34F71A